MQIITKNTIIQKKDIIQIKEITYKVIEILLQPNSDIRVYTLQNINNGKESHYHIETLINNNAETL